MPELARVEVHLPSQAGPYAGYHVVGDQWRHLPVGSTLDPGAGVFSWQIGPGFLGTYELTFVGDAEQVRVRVVVDPQYGEAAGRMAIDTPATGATLVQPFSVAGWAVDLGATRGTGVEAIHVWAYPNPGSEEPPIFLGTADYGGRRPDIGDLFGAEFTEAGYGLTVFGLNPGVYDLVVYAYSSVTGTFSDAQAVRVAIQ